MSRWLGDVCGGKDNNFNLIRIAAAAAVLISHAFPLTLGSGETEPLRLLIGRSLGFVAVSVFFAISGFLIARSFDRNMRLTDWLVARVLRLFPALLVVVLLTAFVLGPLVTVLPAEIYFSDPRVASYVLRNFTLVSLQYDLPGVFGGLPYPRAINGSLWTLIHEVICYAGVLVLGLMGVLRRPQWFAAALAVYVAVYATIALPGMEEVVPGRAILRDLSLPFAIGMTLYVWRDLVPLGWGVCIGLGALAALLHGTPVFDGAFILWLSYTVFVFAYLPDGWIRRYNNLGDYSYGLYIYAFPMQQLTVHLFGPMTPWQNMAIAFPAALFCAMLSWRWIEKSALSARYRVANALAWN